MVRLWLVEQLHGDLRLSKRSPPSGRPHILFSQVTGCAAGRKLYAQSQAFVVPCLPSFNRSNLLRFAWRTAKKASLQLMLGLCGCPKHAKLVVVPRPACLRHKPTFFTEIMCTLQKSTSFTSLHRNSYLMVLMGRLVSRGQYPIIPRRLCGSLLQFVSASRWVYSLVPYPS